MGRGVREQNDTEKSQLTNGKWKKPLKKDRKRQCSKADYLYQKKPDKNRREGCARRQKQK